MRRHHEFYSSGFVSSDALPLALFIERWRARRTLCLAWGAELVWLLQRRRGVIQRAGGGPTVSLRGK